MKRIYLLISLLTTTLIFFACGGGGGGGNEEEETVVYTGSKTPAVITSENANDLADVIFGPESNPLSGVAAKIIDESDVTNSYPANRFLPQVVTDSPMELDDVDITSLPGTTSTYEDEYACEGGGTITEKQELDETTGEFRWTIHFHDCVEYDFYRDGTVVRAGLFNPETRQILKETFSLIYLTESYGAESYTYHGQIYYPDRTMPAEKQIINYVIRDNVSLAVFRYEDYQLVTSAGDYEVSFTVNGRIYHPEHGYVDVITNSPFILKYYEIRFYSGSVIAIGDNSSFKLTCVDNNTYTLAVDSDGDGLYETASTENW